MRDRTLWRLSPTKAEEHFIREQAAKEGRKLSDMTHKLGTKQFSRDRQRSIKHLEIGFDYYAAKPANGQRNDFPQLLSALNSDDELLIAEIADLLLDGTIEPNRINGDAIEEPCV